MTESILHDVLYSPVVGLIGALAVICIFLAPVILMLAGLSPTQIVGLLLDTLKNVLATIQAIRISNKNGTQ